jgi:hypothetical protein
MRTSLSISLIIILVSMAGCFPIPEFPEEPSITFNSAYFQEEPQTDYIYLTLNYKDGDGDLGLNKEDLTSPPFTEFIDSAGKQVLNINRFNIFPVLLRKTGENYIEVTAANYDGIFPRLRDEGFKKGPIEGTIQYKLGSLNFFGQDSSIAKIKVYIQDRKLNKSNIIETPPFPVVYR